MAVESGAAPTIRKNRIHDGHCGGVYFFEGGMGELLDNDVRP